MNTPTNIAIINCGATCYDIKNNTSLQARISKIYAPNQHISELTAHYPEAEIVHEVTLLLQDENIEHVIISHPSKEDFYLVAKVLQAGKQLQIINN